MSAYALSIDVASEAAVKVIIISSFRVWLDVRNVKGHPEASGEHTMGKNQTCDRTSPRLCSVPNLEVF
ncbi:hypothetical protein AV530_005827 [Patagioenas fasciata monilis]|uniref:Uncharacterized protein n=1 Tax=Patagioenas fasciata monilis TaxID=372326 RepID=A0A1V4JP30_PATFA|nr:hypothetical protein AV530_005827 [Patagioenas fasciata monilis]